MVRSLLVVKELVGINLNKFCSNLKLQTQKQSIELENNKSHKTQK